MLSVSHSVGCTHDHMIIRVSTCGVVVFMVKMITRPYYFWFVDLSENI